MGKILNLMRNDVYEVAQRFWEIQGLVQKPLSVVFSITLVVRLLGWPSMLAVLAVIVAQGLIVLLARVRVYFEKKRRVKTDLRLQAVSQFVEAIRHLRWYGWQNAWLTRVMSARQKELNLRIVTEIWSVAIGFVNTLTLDLTPVIAFFAYTVIAGKALHIEIAFPALQLFQMMTRALRDLPDLITILINAYVAVGRIEDYMAEPNKEEMNTEALIGDSMALDNASFAWPGSNVPVLKELNLSFPKKLTVIFGEVGSGKTALLQALLGELDMLSGQLTRPHEPIGYCAQTPWLQSMSIQENILFGAPYNETRYRRVLSLCELNQDLAEFNAGDFSLIGENGIGLSGGQRARIALARALYSNAKILLLDDPLSALAEAWFVKTWGESYSERSSTALFVQESNIIKTDSTFLDNLPPPDVNIRPWLLGFFALAMYQSISFIFFRIVMIIIVYATGKTMFAAIMEKVAGATFRFYDVTPVGRLMNRMTSDIGVIDGNISMQLQAVAWLVIAWVSSIVVIGSITPTFLVFAILLTITFIMIFLRFIPTSQSLRRLEMVSLTPLMSNFGTLLCGLTTVRAFRAQQQFQDRVIRVVDTFQKMDHFYWSLQAWLMYRYDVLSGISTFLITLLALLTNVSAGLTAFVLLSANKLVRSTHALCKQYGQLQMEFVSVERVIELFHLEQEPKGEISPPAWWPSFPGDVVFNDVTIKYASHLDPALAGVSFTIKGSSKTAILGRTGSGKSTLALALLAAVVPEVGQILIDSIDLAKVDKQLLRTRVTFIAQDPVLFPGSMQQNLDPLMEHSQLESELVLERVCGQGWNLNTKVETGGQNLSQGQRQLIGLARAVLRRSAIIILDEATASIDKQTAMKIQAVIHEEMKDSTVITIAHRLEAVKNADYRIVLASGRIVEQGPV